jgi:hypothetical protein
MRLHRVALRSEADCLRSGLYQSQRRMMLTERHPPRARELGD